MRIPESCAKCLYDRQAHKVNDKEYLRRVKAIIDGRSESDTPPYLVYLFNTLYKEMFGKSADYSEIKRKYNDLVLALEDDIRKKINASPDPLAAALQYARIGNYIDFGATNIVDEKEFMSLFGNADMSERDRAVYASFTAQCRTAESFLLICDNCGEIVLDKLFVEQLKKSFPQLSVTALVRGGEVLNDATVDDAEQAGLTAVARVLDNGTSIAGTVYSLLPEEVQQRIDSADVILAKGQGNYESMHGIGRRVFYSFLCKCALFTSRFGVPRLTGMFLEEYGS